MLKTESQRLQRYFHNPIIRGNVGKLSATLPAMCPQVPSSQTLSYPAQPSGTGGLLTAVLGMERAVTRQDLGPQHGQKVTVKCVASIYTAYYKTTEVTVAFRPRRKYRRKQQAETTLGGGNSKHRGQDHQKGNILALASIKIMKVWTQPYLIEPRHHHFLSIMLQAMQIKSKAVGNSGHCGQKYFAVSTLLSIAVVITLHFVS